MNAAALRNETCWPGAAAASAGEIGELLSFLPAWQRQGDSIARSFEFADYYETMAFLNATAWVSHRQDHHPDITLGYNLCRLIYSTHSCGGLSRNDFICAAKIDALLEL